MDFSLTREQQFFRAQVHKAVIELVQPASDSIDKVNRFRAERFFRDARFLLYGGGTSEILKTLIAKEILKEGHREV